jgi:hypothetical protein
VHSVREVAHDNARYLVELAYGIRSDIVSVAQPVYYNPWPGPYWGRPFDPWGPFPATYVNQTYPVFTHLLGIRITERASGREVYNVTARNFGEESSLVRAMPYLARSALSDFPLANGAVHTVKIPLGGGGADVNEVSLPAAAAPAAASPMPASAPQSAQ